MQRTILLSTLGLGLLLVAALWGSAAPASAQAVPAGPSLAVSAQAVTATGMTPGGAVVWLGMARKVIEYEANYVRRQGVVQADALGTAQVPLAEAVPLQSIWVAVDLKTGLFATASREGFSPLAFALAAGALEVRGAGLADRLLDAADYGEVLLVRPGKGAWGKTVGRGGAGDESDPSEPTYKVSLDRLEPVSGADGPAPGKLSPRDLLFVLHPQAMALAVVVFGGKP
jgi:hypothetical protein